MHAKSKGGGNDLNDSDYDGEEEVTFNSGHIALSRQKKKSKKGK